jgi:L-histidine Nalpha-methyltransferase
VDRVRIDVLVNEADRRTALHDATLRGLRDIPKQVPVIWLYDELGSQLFEDITRLPEYYPTRREREILDGRAAEIAALTRAQTLVELGSGTSEKTRLLLDALAAEGSLRRFVPLDVSEKVLVASAREIADDYPGIEVHAIVGDFERHLSAVPRDDRRLVAFLGSTIGNLLPDGRARFLGTAANCLGVDDALLLGLDLVKDPGRIEAAYSDSHGLTEAFVRNALLVLDLELEATFSRVRFDYFATWNPENEWVEIGFRSVGEQLVRVEVLGIDVAFADGEPLRMEVSSKFRRDRIERELAEAGLRLERWWTDDSNEFALALAVRSRHERPSA